MSLAGSDQDPIGSDILSHTLANRMLQESHTNRAWRQLPFPTVAPPPLPNKATSLHRPLKSKAISVLAWQACQITSPNNEPMPGGQVKLQHTQNNDHALFTLYSPSPCYLTGPSPVRPQAASFLGDGAPPDQSLPCYRAIAASKRYAMEGCPRFSQLLRHRRPLLSRVQGGWGMCRSRRQSLPLGFLGWPSLESVRTGQCRNKGN